MEPVPSRCVGSVKAERQGEALPIAAHLQRADARFAAAWWHWFFLAQTAKPAERVIGLDPDTWYNAWTTNRPERLGPENHADFLAAIRDPATVHGMCEDSPRRTAFTPSERRGGTGSGGPARVSASIGRTTRPTSPPAAPCTVRRRCSGRSATT
jgi:hypothetical protein